MRHRPPLTGPLGRVALVFLLATPIRLLAQGEGPLTLDVGSPDGSVEADLSGLLLGPRIRGALESGLPVRVLLVTGLWRDRFFDAQMGRYEWRASVRYDPLAETYRVLTTEGAVAQTASLEDADELLSNSVRVPLGPTAPGRYYYLARVEVETLALSDLEELERWLQGDLAPSIDRDVEVGSALGRGLTRIFVRVLGLPIQRFQARSPAFDWDG